MARKLLIVYTGGTIGMKQTPAGLAPAPDLTAQMHVLAELGPAFHKNPPDLVSLVYDPLIDSSDMTPALWIKIARDIEQRFDQYDGFVVLHGTDTLAYTSSALSFFIRRRGKPVVLTGAQLPFGFPRSDARANLISAIEVAATMPEPMAQVCVVFGSKILQGNRATKISARAYDAFDSPRFPPLGHIGIDIQYLGQRSLVESVPAVSGMLNPPADGTVALLRVFPGISAEIFNALCAAPHLQAVVLEAYGSGNAPIRDSRFVTAVRAAVERGIVVLVVSQPLDGVVTFERYAAGSGLAGAGAISGRDMTPEAAVTKLYYLIACGLTTEQIKDALQQSLAGEMT